MVNFFVSRFTVNKNAQTSSRTRTHAAAATRDVLVWMPGRNSLIHVLYCNVEPVFGGLWARNVSIGRRAVVTRRGDMKSYSQYETH